MSAMIDAAALILGWAATFAPCSSTDPRTTSRRRPAPRPRHRLEGPALLVHRLKA